MVSWSPYCSNSAALKYTSNFLWAARVYIWAARVRSLFRLGRVRRHTRKEMAVDPCDTSEITVDPCPTCHQHFTHSNPQCPINEFDEECEHCTQCCTTGHCAHCGVNGLSIGCGRWDPIWTYYTHCNEPNCGDMFHVHDDCNDGSQCSLCKSYYCQVCVEDVYLSNTQIHPGKPCQLTTPIDKDSADFGHLGSDSEE